MRRLVLSLLILSSLVLLMPSSASQEVIVSVEGPETMPIGGSSQFQIIAMGGPAEKGGTYNITAFLLGDNLEGASPSPGDIFINSTTEPDWIINVTVPLVAQTMTLVVNITSDYENESAFRRVSTEIRVVGPIVLSAEISNPLDYELREMPVDFYVRAPGESQDRLVGSATIESIPPGGSEYASFDWIVADPQPGEYRLTVVVDLDRDGDINENAGDSVAVSYFYVGGGVNLVTWALAILLVLLIVVSMIWLLTRPRRRP